MAGLLIDVAQLQQAITTPGWLVFDVRHELSDHEAGRRAYEQGHVPGAIFLDHERQLSAHKTGHNGRHPLPALADFAVLMRLQGLTSKTQVVVYDAGNGMFAAHLWWMLRWLGHENVAVLDGGWQAWVAAGGKIETRVNTGAVTEAQALQSMGYGPAPAMPTVDAAEILSNVESGVLTVLDARAANRFRGEVEPMDPVAGHIPGAINRPSSLNIGPDGHFKPADVLRAEFEALLGATLPSNVVHQCGSGITASHNLFSMEVAGLKGSRLYPGSWSEWCSDPARPIARTSDN
jgi:thiosulfate/3-mercaptopyruvate sulfurtransferase